MLIAISFTLAGCPPPPKVAEVAGATKTPPPRPADDDAPDLYKGKFMVTEAGQAGMRGDGIPDDVVGKLDSLKGQEFLNASEFFTAVGGSIGDAALSQHRDVIVRHSLMTELMAEVAFPGQKLVLANGAMGSDRFKPIYFDYDRSDIKPEFTEAIQYNASELNKDPSVKVLIEGHCDERGTTEYNLALGQRRARSVRKALIEAGVDPKRLSIVSYGEERPAVSESNEEAWAKNRRAVFSEK